MSRDTVQPHFPHRTPAVGGPEGLPPRPRPCAPRWAPCRHRARRPAGGQHSGCAAGGRCWAPAGTPSLGAGRPRWHARRCPPRVWGVSHTMVPESVGADCRKLNHLRLQQGEPAARSAPSRMSERLSSKADLRRQSGSASALMLRAGGSRSAPAAAPKRGAAASGPAPPVPPLTWLLGYRGADSEPARLIARTGGPAQSRSGVVRWRRSGCKRRLWSGCGIIAKWLIEAVGGRIGRRTPSGVRRTKDSGIGHETHLLANRTHTRGRCVHGGGP